VGFELKENFKYMYKQFKIGIFVTTVIVVAGCSSAPDPQSTLAEVKQAFQDSILALEAEQKNVKTNFKEGKSSLLSFQSALKSAQDKDKEFAKVYNRWREIQGRISELYDKFLGLVKGADRVYSELDNRANKIMNPDLRERIRGELQASIERYAGRLKLSKSGIDRLRDQATKVTDVMSALEVRFTLKVVEDELGNIFKDIDETVEAVMAQLEVLIEESKHFPMASPLERHG
jgi:chromosome segregation ATPase